jgi:hypothetical protein
VWLLAKTVISRASLTLCFISVHAAEEPSRALWREGEGSVRSDSRWGVAACQNRDQPREI